MPKLIAQVAAVAVTVSVVLAVVLVRPADTDSAPASRSTTTPAPAHGDFHNRLQPKLNGIGEFSSLPPVAMPDAEGSRLAVRVARARTR